MKQPRIHRDRQPVFTADGPAAAMARLGRPGEGNPEDAIACIGDVIVGLGEEAEFDPGEWDADCHIQVFGSGGHALEVWFTGTGDAEDYIASAYLLIDSSTPIEFLAAGGTPATNALQVGLWENAFTEQGGAVAFQHKDFINHDARRFRVRVTDPANESGSVTVSLSTRGAGHSQAARELTLLRVSPGVFVSTNLLLVSDAADAAVSPSETVPGINGRLFECGLGGTVRAVFTDSAGTGAKIGRDVKDVTVDVFVMTRGGVPAVSGAIAERDLADMAERYAQTDVRINVGQTAHVEMPFAHTNWYVRRENVTENYLYLSPDAKSILDALPRTSGHVGVVYVHGPLYPFWYDADPTLLEATNRTVLAGTAIVASAFPRDLSYAGNVFISSTESAVLFVPAHEAGHILIEDKHSSHRYNLMWEFGIRHKEANGPKRLDPSQIEKIRRSSYTR